MTTGILSKAVEAKEKTEQNSNLEQIKLAIIAALSKDNSSINKDILDKELKNYGFEESTVDEDNNYITNKGEKVFEISSEGDISEIVTKPPTEKVTIDTKFVDSNSEEKIAIIPEGFKVSSITDEQCIDNGLVVIAPDDSEFVWIPIENPSSLYGIDKDGNYLGKLYSFNDDGTTSNLNWTEEKGIMSYQDLEINQEPSVLGQELEADELYMRNFREIIGITGSNDEILSKWDEQLKKDFKEIIISVEKNHGFYVSRYEMSLNEDDEAQSKKDIEPAIAQNSKLNWYGLYQKQREYSNNISTSVGSSMIWGCLYDQMVMWLKNSQIQVNYGDISSNSGKTGKDENDKLNNIYDLLGNYKEWTLETGSYGGRVYRRIWQ